MVQTEIFFERKIGKRKLNPGSFDTCLWASIGIDILKIDYN
jgi:hypothetical protein